MHRIVILAAALVLAPATAVVAQPPTNFTGDWTLNVTDSNFGGMPAPASLTQTIAHDEPSVKIASRQTGDFGDMAADFAFTTDGRECVNTIAGLVVKSTLKWDGPVLVVDSTMDFQGSPMTMTDRWSLSSNGTQMVVDRKVAGPMGEGTAKIVFDKQ